MGQIVKIFGEHEDKVVQQLENCVAQEEGSIGALMGDAHFGYSAPIGGVVGYHEYVSPAAVGYDIGCGNLALPTNILYGMDFREALPGLMDDIFKKVSFGMEAGTGRAKDHPVIDEIRHAEFEPQRELLDKAAKQLGTVGGGNHYVDLFRDEKTDRIWVGVHFGSRGFGHKTASGFLAMAKGLTFNDRVPEGEMAAPPDVLHVDSALGYCYIEAMKLAGKYAYAGREVVVDQVMEILGAEPAGLPIHNHHNFAWQENHGGQNLWVVRKGATPAFPGQYGFVGASMGEPAVILRGIQSAEAEEAMYSTVHGAGRAMSRKKAAGKQRKRWTCNNRECDWVQQPHTHKPEDGNCPECSHPKLSKRWVQETEGVIDWQATLNDLEVKRIELRGANAEEAPGAYKRLSEVLEHHAGTVEIVHTLIPIGVAMAPGDVVDPYKD